ncbi:hypothetical protein K0M31_010421 [Melipona bicolor]|uniref:Uncharacterized protein n=1 Tax=Melipona bicolor TaxID=60889 RepID=A0AA40FMS9_9HYME|nr:hypothetical protein K0M31_010421 [Melipona bicolor]
MWGDTLAGGSSGRGGIREITGFVGAARKELPSQEFERTGTLEEHWWRRRKRGTEIAGSATVDVFAPEFRPGPGRRKEETRC